MFDKVIVKVSLQCCCGDILTVQPCHCYCYDCVDVVFRILMPNLFYFDLEYIFRDLCKHLVGAITLGKFQRQISETLTREGHL